MGSSDGSASVKSYRTRIKSIVIHLRMVLGVLEVGIFGQLLSYRWFRETDNASMIIQVGVVSTEKLWR